MPCDVWVYVTVGDKTECEYISVTSADHGEVVAALQVLYPNYAGCLICPETNDVEEE